MTSTGDASRRTGRDGVGLVRESASGRRRAAGMELLVAGVPLTLLLDLALGPDSTGTYAEEPGDTGWLPRTA